MKTSPLQPAANANSGGNASNAIFLFITIADFGMRIYEIIPCLLHRPAGTDEEVHLIRQVFYLPFVLLEPCINLFQPRIDDMAFEQIFLQALSV